MPEDSSDGISIGEPVVLGPQDLRACLQLDQSALDGLWNAEQWRSELSEPGRLCVGLQAGDELVALASGWLVADELQINAVAVAPQRQRLGLGTQVLEALLSAAMSAGARRATLEVARCNTAALSLYRRCGFTTHGCRRGYYSDGRDALIQWKELV